MATSKQMKSYQGSNGMKLHHEKMCPIYASFFKIARRLGVFPYTFDPETLQVTPVRTGFSYFQFLFNMTYLMFLTCKVTILFLENWRTNFEFDEFVGGYNIQLTYLSGHLLHFAMLTGIVLKMDKFAFAVSSAIRFEAKFMKDNFTPATKTLFFKRFKSLRLQYWVIFVGFGAGCPVVFLTMNCLFPRLPGNINYYFKTESGPLHIFIILFESYMGPLACGIISGTTLVIYITFGGIMTNITAFNTLLKDPMVSQREKARIVREYKLLGFSLQPLSSLFSISFMLQEYNFLTAVSLFIVGGVNMERYDSVSLVVWGYMNAVWMFSLLIIQFYPMILINLYSQETVTLMNHLVLDKTERAEAQASRGLKVRPMGLHTISMETLNDYVNFIVSMLLMFLKE